MYLRYDGHYGVITASEADGTQQKDRCWERRGQGRTAPR